jgi:UDP:flavonoid glycosyltransferase YjiC (YdhE family)
MKILLVTRGSQGDIYPYLALGTALQKHGHQITLSLPRLFEPEARDAELPYVLQASDDIAGMLEGTPNTRRLLEWTRRVIDSQFKELIPLLAEQDLLIATNTEFAAPSIAEYCGKPHIRTAYGPLLPSRVIPPPVFPWSPPLASPALLWGVLNTGLNLMVKKTLNNNRRVLGLPPIADQAEHAPAQGDNYLLYSPSLGAIDPGWKYRWAIGGYCFNDGFPYDGEVLERLLAFIRQDSRPTVFFTLGSCNVDQRDRFAELLLEICTARRYKLAVNCGWWKLGARLQTRDNLFRIETPIPHRLVFPHCAAIVHHGGVGTTHSAARSGKPQMVVPLILDQFYWARRVKELGAGPGGLKIRGISREKLDRALSALVDSPSDREKAAALGLRIEAEEGILNFCRHVETYVPRAGSLG